jgi:Tol biopolymer transport system component
MTLPTLEKPNLDFVEKVIALPEVEILDLSPDGRSALALSNHTGSYQLASIPVQGGSLREVTHGKERVSWARISHNSGQVAFSRDFGGKEEHQLFQVPLAGGVENQIAQLPPVRIFDFAWSRDDRRIAFGGASQEFNALWMVDVDTGKLTDVYKCKHLVFGPDWSRNDETVCFSAKTTDHPTAMELLFLAGDGKGGALALHA